MPSMKEKRCLLNFIESRGTGLNLTGADTVILYDLWWNPQSKNKRLVGHTAWDKKVVEVWRMIAEGTVEEK